MVWPIEGLCLTRENIQDCLKHPKNGDNNRKLLTFLRTPRTVGDLSRAGIKGNAINVLTELKKAGAVDFVDGKYIASQLGLDVLNSI